MSDLARILGLERFIALMDKHIDLVERRLIKGEKIPHAEKLFSIFEDYTEWITKGKLRPKFELGKRTSITSDQYGLIIDCLIHENEADSKVVIKIADRLLPKHKIGTWSFDKGYRAFKRYVALSVVAYNLHKIGRELIKQELKKKEKTRWRKVRKLAA